MNRVLIKVGCLICFVITIFGQNQTIEDIIKAEQEKLNNIQKNDSAIHQKIERNYRHYEKSITKEYQKAEQEARRELEEMKEKILEKWDDLKLKSNKEYVEYDKNFNSRGEINFEEGKVEIEAIAEKDDPQAGQKARQRVKERLKKLINAKAADNQTLLDKQLTDARGKSVDQTNIDNYIDSEVDKKIEKKKEFNSRDGKKRIKYIVEIPMVPNHIEIRAQRYKKNVLKEAENFNIDPALVMAIIHTESAFNPQAKSYIPAYGLMQLVPGTGARDAYNYIYKSDRYLSSSYLYNPQNNIKLGCAYLAKLRYVYFKNVNNSENARFCVISSYNGGIGTVAKTICGKSSLKSASQVVNANEPDWTYSTLENRLPARETRNYLRKVTSRQEMYENWLSS